MTDDDLIETISKRYRYSIEPMPRAKPEEQPTRGMRVEDFFGICAEEFDDEFMESLREIRRGLWATGEVRTAQVRLPAVSRRPLDLDMRCQCST